MRPQAKIKRTKKINKHATMWYCVRDKIFSPRHQEQKGVVVRLSPNSWSSKWQDGWMHYCACWCVYCIVVGVTDVHTECSDHKIKPICSVTTHVQEQSISTTLWKYHRLLLSPKTIPNFVLIVTNITYSCVRGIGFTMLQITTLVRRCEVGVTWAMSQRWSHTHHAPPESQ